MVESSSRGSSSISLDVNAYDHYSIEEEAGLYPHIPRQISTVTEDPRKTDEEQNLL
jgi:hypothetical protein